MYSGHSSDERSIQCCQEKTLDKKRDLLYSDRGVPVESIYYSGILGIYLWRRL